MRGTRGRDLVLPRVRCWSYVALFSMCPVGTRALFSCLGLERAPDVFAGGKYAEELLLAVQAVQKACVMAAVVQREQRSGWTKDDSSPVTVADFAAQALVLDHLGSRYADDGVVAEESSDGLPDDLRDIARYAAMDEAEVYEAVGRGGQRTERRWILDPIDGTRGFLRGDQYCTALALLVDNEPVLSVIGAPNLSLVPGRKGCLAIAVKNRGAFVFEDSKESSSGTWRRLEVSKVGIDTPLTLVEGVESSHSNHAWANRAVRRVNAAAHRSLKLDSQAKAIVLADGKADCFLRLPKGGYVEKIWDVAPAALLVTEAGGLFTDRRGNSLDWSLGANLSPKVDGLCAANNNLHHHLIDALAKEELDE